MKLKKKFGLIVFIVGIVMVGGSFYIENQVLQGKEQISSAENSLNRAKTLFSLTPTTKQIGEGISKSADRKIASANQEIASYESLSQFLLVGGVILIVLGAGLFIVV